MKCPKLMILPLVATALAGCSETSNPEAVAEKPVAEAAKTAKAAYEGIQWVKNTDGVTFDQVKQMAKEQNKHIFLDFYTKWCGPCKNMDRNVFPLKEVGDYYNAKFINFKIDAEVGEGATLAEQYKVEGFPTYAYTDTDGNELGRGTSIGRSEGHEGIVQLAKEALGESEAKPWSWYKEQFANGNRELAFLKEYFDLRMAEERIPPSIGDWELLYKATPEEGRLDVKGSQPYNYLLYASIPGNFFYDELLKHRDRYEDVLNDPYQGTMRLVGTYTKNQFERFTTEAKIDEALKRDFPKFFDAAKEFVAIDQMRFSDNPDNDAYVAAYIDYVDRQGFPFDTNPYIGSSITGMKNLSPEIARRAIPMYEKNIKQDPSHFYSQVNYAYLVYKSGDKAAAKAHAESLKALTESFASSNKMAQMFQVMRKIEAGEDPTEIMLMPREAFIKPKPEA